MARNSTSTLGRDDRGRFVSDDDRRYSRPRDEEGRFTGSRYDDDDDDRRYSRPRDEEGRFTSSRSRSSSSLALSKAVMADVCTRSGATLAPGQMVQDAAQAFKCLASASATSLRDHPSEGNG